LENPKSFLSPYFSANVSSLVAPLQPASWNRPCLGKIGLEMEIFVYDRLIWQPLAMGCVSAPSAYGIQRRPNVVCTPQELLNRVHKLVPGSLRVFDAPTGELIGLNLPWEANFSLEPGGHVEYSSSPCLSWKHLAKETTQALRLLSEAGRGEVLFFSHGTHPLRFDPVPLAVPKRRYLILDRYLGSQSKGQGRHMMRGTATIQPNVDVVYYPKLLADTYESSWDQMVRCVIDVHPFVSYLFANSFFFNGQKNTTTLSHRQDIWAHMDKTRTGYPPASPDVPIAESYAHWGYQAYVWYMNKLTVADQPLYGQLTFAHWMEKGFQGTKPDAQDWLNHLGSLFPDLRLPSFLEIRNTDAQPFAYTMAPIVFWHILLQTPAGQQCLKAFCQSWPQARRQHWELNTVPVNPLLKQGAEDLFQQTVSAAKEQNLDEEAEVLKSYQRFSETKDRLRHQSVDALGFLRSQATVMPY